jgi:tRNA modification GTPase
VACNKADRTAKVSLKELRARLPESRIVSISALHGTGIEELREAVAATLMVNGTGLAPHTVIAAVRHARALEKTIEALEHAQQGLRTGIPPEFVAADFQFAAQHLGEITGTSTSDEVIHGIFSRFCIGK